MKFRYKKATAGLGRGTHTHTGIGCKAIERQENVEASVDRSLKSLGSK